MSDDIEYEDEEEFDYSERSRMVTPGCCATGDKYRAVFLVMPIEWYDGDQEKPPSWVIKGKSDEFPGHDFETTVPASHCPFCGKLLPDIIKVTPPGPVASCTDGGYYCATCHQRLNECRCYRPEHAWGPNKYDPNFGDTRVCECGHHYYRHFDPYENDDPVGCKYCRCAVFKEKKDVQKETPEAGTNPRATGDVEPDQAGDGGSANPDPSSSEADRPASG